MSEGTFPRNWLILDVPFLCNRAFHAYPNLQKDDISTQVIYGVMVDISKLMTEFRTTDVIFCFDSRKSVRKEYFPEYKAKRREQRTEQEEEARKELYRQIDLLRNKYLHEIGFPNVFTQKGYESDDLMASIARTLPVTDKIVIVTADHDLFQCIAHNVRIHDPQRNKIMSVDRLMSEYGVTPEQWGLVKAIGGCKSDCVPAVAERVGEKGAINWVLGNLKDTSAVKQKIDAAVYTPEGKSSAIFKRNRALTKLPHKGTAVIEPEAGAVLSEEGWFSVCEELGFGEQMKTGRGNPFLFHMETESKRRHRNDWKR